MASLSLAFDILARDRASKTLDDVGDAADRTGERGRKLGAAMGLGLAAAGAAAVKFGADSVRAYVDSEQASARLDEALRKFPATNDVTRASFDSLNAALAQKTKFDDDATASGQAVLAQYKLTGSQIQELTPLLQDYAAKTGRDLPAAAEVLGKALQGKGKSLADVGIKFKDAGSTGANFEQIMGGLRTQVGGFATVEGKTAAGQAAILKNQFGEVQEQVGAKLVPVLTTLAGKLLEVINFVDRNKGAIIPLVAVIGTLVAIVKTYQVTTALATAAQALFTGGTVAQTGATTAATTAQTGLNVAMRLNPIGLVVTGIALLVAGFVLAYKKSETFRNMVHTLWDWLKKFIGFTPLGALITNFDKVRDSIGWVIDKVQDLIGWLKKIKMPDIDLPGGGILGKIPGFAGGVSNFSGGLAMVGERGRELVSLPAGSSVTPHAETEALISGGGEVAGLLRETNRLLRAMPREQLMALRAAT